MALLQTLGIQPEGVQVTWWAMFDQVVISHVLGYFSVGLVGPRLVLRSSPPIESWHSLQFLSGSIGQFRATVMVSHNSMVHRESKVMSTHYFYHTFYILMETGTTINISVVSVPLNIPANVIKTRRWWCGLQGDLLSLILKGANWKLITMSFKASVSKMY